jgi:ELWxxDGT repeat protein
MADDGVTGKELWATDGTAAGTNLLADINPGPGSSAPGVVDSALFNGKLYFNADDGANGTELWATDGTALGTVLVSDLSPGTDGSRPKHFRVVGGQLFFAAHGGAALGVELYKVDGAGLVSLVKDIYPGPSSSFGTTPKTMIGVGGKLFFSASDGFSGHELWESDGTALGTLLVKDIRAGAFASHPASLTPISPTSFLFHADDGIFGDELWISDGTSAGTTILAEPDSSLFTGDANPMHLVSLDGYSVLFQAEEAVHGAELWSVDRAGNVALLKDINPGQNGSLPGPLYRMWLADHAVTFFGALTDPGGVELWVTDGTSPGTVQLLDLDPSADGSYFPSQFYVHQGKAYFAADSGSGMELHTSDGTAAGTIQVADINTALFSQGNSNPRDFVSLGGLLYFVANDGINGERLWSTDGTQGGTQTLGQSPLVNYAAPASLVKLHNRIYFPASDNGLGVELWATDGTSAGTVMVADINSGSASSFPTEFKVVGGRLCFRAYQQSTGYEPHATDGTAAGTVLLANTNPVGDGSPRGFTLMDGLAYFISNSGSGALDLWRTDGTPTGTSLAWSAPGVSLGTPILSTGRELYFAANETLTGLELWKYEGPILGASMVCDVNPGISHASPSGFTLANGQLYFSALGGNAGRELFSVPVPAYSSDLGFHGTGIELVGSAPKFGSSVTFKCEGIAPGAPSLFLISLPVIAPNHFLLAPGSASWIDASSFSVLGAFGTASWTHSIPIPLDPSLSGTRLNAQTYSFPGGGFPAQTSNGLALVWGL